MKGILDGHWNRRLYWMGGHGLFESQEASQKWLNIKKSIYSGTLSAMNVLEILTKR
jgi:hypothetical protein